MNKYRNIKTTVDGYKFDSLKEARRYETLKLMVKAGEITELLLQPKFDLIVNDVKIGKYIADFRYREGVSGSYIIEDVKGIKTPLYRLKAKLVKALHGIDIVEI